MLVVYDETEDEREDSIKVLYPGDMITGIDILYFNVSFIAVVIDVTITPNRFGDPYQVYDFGLDYNGSSIGDNRDVRYSLWIMYEDGYSTFLKANIQLLKDLKLLYRK
jgi:hypothetical protein